MYDKKQMDTAYNFLVMYNTDNRDELYHHGILGQKWGVRRYQNEDGTLTPEGRKRYGRDIVNKYRTDSHVKVGYRLGTDEFSKSVTDLARKSIPNEQLKELADKRRKWIVVQKEANNEPNFEDSKEWKECIAEAHKQTIESVKRDMPEYYAELVERYGKDDTAKYSFDKTFDKIESYTRSDISDKYEKAFLDRNKDRLKLKKEADKLFDDYYSSQEQMIEGIMGEYGNIKVKNGITLNEIMSENINSEELLKNY